MGYTTNWRIEIASAIGKNDDKLIHCTLSEDELDVLFNSSYGGGEGKPFTAWGEKYVYFPIVYDGAEWVGWAPRNPCDEAMVHQGGE
jgi:hypothetical protein